MLPAAVCLLRSAARQPSVSIIALLAGRYRHQTDLETTKMLNKTIELLKESKEVVASIIDRIVIHGRQRLRFEMKSYQDMIVIPMKQMSGDNQQLHWLKKKVVKQERRSKALEATFEVAAQKLHETLEENMVVRLRTKTQQEENWIVRLRTKTLQEENKEHVIPHEKDFSIMEYLEKFYKEQTANVHKDI